MRRAIDFLVPSKIVALALLVLSVGFGIASLRLGLFANGMPSVGLTPMLGCIVLLPISVLLLLEPIEKAEQESRLEGIPILAGLAFCLLALAMKTIGFVTPAILFLLFWTRWLYGRSWRVSLLTAAGITGVLALLFVTVLGVPMQLWPW